MFLQQATCLLFPAWGPIILFWHRFIKSGIHSFLKIHLENLHCNLQILNQSGPCSKNRHLCILQPNNLLVDTGAKRGYRNERGFLSGLVVPRVLVKQQREWLSEVSICGHIQKKLLEYLCYRGSLERSGQITFGQFIRWLEDEARLLFF